MTNINIMHGIYCQHWYIFSQQIKRLKWYYVKNNQLLHHECGCHREHGKYGTDSRHHIMSDIVIS